MRQDWRDGGKHLQLDLYPSLLFGRGDVGLFFSLGASLDGIPVSVIPDYGGDLGVPGLVLLSREAAMWNHVSPRVSTGMEGEQRG